MVGWRLWLAGLASALINGFASGIVLIIADPVAFNLQDGWRKLLSTSFILGIFGMANYLKSHPLPEDTDRKEVWTEDEREHKRDTGEDPKP